MVLRVMLQSFRGTFDSVGIRSLRVERDDERTGILGDVAEFWAVVDTEFALQVRTALSHGDRTSATRLLSDSATSMGSILPS